MGDRMTKKTIGFIGLGVMGAPMARHLIAVGHEVRVYNRTTAKAEAFVGAHGGSLALTPVAAADGADVVLSCVGNDDDLRAITLGAGGAFGGMAKGTLFIDHSTVSAALARELAAEAEANGFSFVDAPVSGGQAGAENGKLSIMCGGSDEAFARAHVLDEARRLRGGKVRPRQPAQNARADHRQIAHPGHRDAARGRAHRLRLRAHRRSGSRATVLRRTAGHLAARGRRPQLQPG